jgi:general secretion pathway protein D
VNFIRRSLIPAAMLAALLAAAEPCAAASATAPAAKAGRADNYTFAFHDALISQAADEILGRTLGLDFTVDPEVTGKISFRIEQRLTKAQLLEAFEAALGANGVAMVRNGEALVLTPRAKAKEAAGLRVRSEGAVSAGYEVVALPLTFATPSEVAKALQSMGRGDMVVYADDKLGLMLLGGSARELEAAEQTLKVLDQSGLQASRIRWFDVTRATASTVANELDQVLTASGATGVTVVPLKRLNGLLVFARTPRALDDVAVWIDKLDAPSKEEQASLWVYRPLNLSAEALADTLGAVLGGGSAGSSSPLPAGPVHATDPGGKAAPAAPAAASHADVDSGVRIGVSKESNALIVTAPASRWVQIKRVLDEVDVTPRQVLIEASILEVTLSNGLQFGVDWRVVGAGGKLKVANVANAAGTVAPSFPGFAATYLDKDIQAAVSALKSITDVEVVSAPRLVTLDNHAARLQVGDQVPIVTKTAQSTQTADAPLVSNTEYRDTGVILKVTPRVSGDSQVVLEIEQEVSSVAKTTSSGIDSPTIQQRKVQSTLILNDGAAVALGGLISQNRTRERSGTPVAQNIPVLGALFRSTSNEGKRTELIVLISARVIRDVASRERVMKDLMADMKEIEARGLFPH